MSVAILAQPPFKLSLRIEEAASALGVSRSTVIRAIDRGELTRRYIDSVPVLLVKELEDWLATLPEEPVKRR